VALYNRAVKVSIPIDKLVWCRYPIEDTSYSNERKLALKPLLARAYIMFLLRRTVLDHKLRLAGFSPTSVFYSDCVESPFVGMAPMQWRRACINDLNGLRSCWTFLTAFQTVWNFTIFEVRWWTHWRQPPMYNKEFDEKSPRSESCRISIVVIRRTAISRQNQDMTQTLWCRTFALAVLFCNCTCT
jgi:hypothetical protein